MRAPFLVLTLALTVSPAMAMCNYTVYPPICDVAAGVLHVGTVQPSLFIPALTSPRWNDLGTSETLLRWAILPATQCPKHRPGDLAGVPCR